MAGGQSPAKRSREDKNEKEAAQDPTKRPRYDYNDTISVLIGSEERRFVVHKDVICSSSKFFKAACSANWKEGQEGIVRLPTAKPPVFEMYMDWLYFSEIGGKVRRDDHEGQPRSLRASHRGLPSRIRAGGCTEAVEAETNHD